jgi:hypothetical protein
LRRAPPGAENSLPRPEKSRPSSLRGDTCSPTVALVPLMLRFAEVLHRSKKHLETAMGPPSLERAPSAFAYASTMMSGEPIIGDTP